ncbi:MAG: biopolymer transporter ExbD [Deltaproteobacteria bacterium]|nr:biopolymer transporter ExbD [Deltaproteobacteria bacterium]
MAKKPSERTHRLKPLEGLNLVPMIDVVTNLMFFLLMFAGILPVAIIDAPQPKIASTAEEVKRAQEEETRLALTVWVNNAGLNVKSDWAGSKTFPVRPDGKYPYEELHSYLVQIHTQKPASKEITVIPSDETLYDAVIQVMDAARELRKGDAGYKQVPPEIVHKPESLQFNRLYPDVSIGGV